MRKRLSFLSICLLLVLVGCGSSSDTTNNKEDATEQEDKKVEEKEPDTSGLILLPLSTSLQADGSFMNEQDVKPDSFTPMVYFKVPEETGCAQYDWVSLNEDGVPTLTGSLGFSITQEKIDDLEAVPSRYSIMTDFGNGDIAIYDIAKQKEYEESYPKLNGLYVTAGKVELAESIPNIKDMYNTEVKDIESGEGKSDGIPYRYALITFGGEIHDGSQNFVMVYEVEDNVQVLLNLWDVNEDFDLKEAVAYFGNSLTKESN